MAGRVFVTGASGFVGRQVIEELIARDYGVNALVHRGALARRDPALRDITGDLFNPSILDEGIRGCSAVIHLVGIISERPSDGVTFDRMHFEGARAVVDAARRNAVPRYVHMSALGTRPGAASDYHRTKWQAEEYVRKSGLDWTIFRPALIHGPGGFMQTEAAWARKSALPFIGMPYFGSGLLGLGGAGLLQPIYVNDVARAFVDAIERSQTIHKTYEIAGPDRFTWPQFHQAAAAELVGRKRLTLPLPAWWARLLAGAGLGPLLGFSRDQVVMSQEHNIADLASFEHDFGWSPHPFRPALRQYAPNL